MKCTVNLLNKEYYFPNFKRIYLIKQILGDKKTIPLLTLIQAINNKNNK